MGRRLTVPVKKGSLSIGFRIDGNRITLHQRRWLELMLPIICSRYVAPEFSDIRQGIFRLTGWHAGAAPLVQRP